MNRGGNDIVAGLAEIHMVVRMDEFAPSCPIQEFGGPVGNDFIGVHIGRRTGAGLEDINGEFPIQPSSNNLPARFSDRV